MVPRGVCRSSISSWTPTVTKGYTKYKNGESRLYNPIIVVHVSEKGRWNPSEYVNWSEGVARVSVSSMTGGWIVVLEVDVKISVTMETGGPWFIGLNERKGFRPYTVRATGGDV